MRNRSATRRGHDRPAGAIASPAGTSGWPVSRIAMKPDPRHVLATLVADIYYRDYRDEQRHPFHFNVAYKDAVAALRRDSDGPGAGERQALTCLVEQLSLNDPADSRGAAIDSAAYKWAETFLQHAGRGAEVVGPHVRHAPARH